MRQRAGSPNCLLPVNTFCGTTREGPRFPPELLCFDSIFFDLISKIEHFVKVDVYVSLNTATKKNGHIPSAHPNMSDLFERLANTLCGVNSLSSEGASPSISSSSTSSALTSIDSLTTTLQLVAILIGAMTLAIACVLQYLTTQARNDARSYRRQVKETMANVREDQAVHQEVVDAYRHETNQLLEAIEMAEEAVLKVKGRAARRVAATRTLRAMNQRLYEEYCGDSGDGEASADADVNADAEEQFDEEDGGKEEGGEGHPSQRGSPAAASFVPLDAGADEPPLADTTHDPRGRSHRSSGSCSSGGGLLAVHENIVAAAKERMIRAAEERDANLEALRIVDMERQVLEAQYHAMRHEQLDEIEIGLQQRFAELRSATSSVGAVRGADEDNMTQEDEEADGDFHEESDEQEDADDDVVAIGDSLTPATKRYHQALLRPDAPSADRRAARDRLIRDVSALQQENELLMRDVEAGWRESENLTLTALEQDDIMREMAFILRSAEREAVTGVASVSISLLVDVEEEASHDDTASRGGSRLTRVVTHVDEGSVELDADSDFTEVQADADRERVGDDFVAVATTDRDGSSTTDGSSSAPSEFKPRPRLSGPVDGTETPHEQSLTADMEGGKPVHLVASPAPPGLSVQQQCQWLSGFVEEAQVALEDAISELESGGIDPAQHTTSSCDEDAGITTNNTAADVVAQWQRVPTGGETRRRGDDFVDDHRPSSIQPPRPPIFPLAPRATITSSINNVGVDESVITSAVSNRCKQSPHVALPRNGKKESHVPRLHDDDVDERHAAAASFRSKVDSTASGASSYAPSMTAVAAPGSRRRGGIAHVDKEN